MKVPFGSSKHVQQLWERGLNLVNVKVNNELRKGVQKRLKNKVRAHLNREFNSEHYQPLSTGSSIPSTTNLSIHSINLVNEHVQKMTQPSEP